MVLWQTVKTQIMKYSLYCKLGNFREGFIFVKIKSSRNCEIILSFTDIGKSCPSGEFKCRKYMF